MKLIEIVKPFLDVEDTCEEVIEYFKSGKAAQGSYIHLAKYFLDDTYCRHSELDEAYKNWLRDLIEERREKDSIILSVLNEKYSEKENITKFIFSLNGIPPELNQKWHYYIAYWGLREYVTKHPEKNKEKLNGLKDGYEASRGNPFKKCQEGKIWYERAVNGKLTELL